MTRPFRTTLLLTLCFAAMLGGCDEDAPRFEQLTLAGRQFRLELALTDAKIARGLMFRDKLADDEGMLFVFRDMAVRHFWMKNCLIPIDVIFIDGQGWITAIHTMPPPSPDVPDEELPRYSSVLPARFAIEIAGGTAQKLGLAAGQKLDLPLDHLKQMVQ